MCFANETPFSELNFVTILAAQGTHVACYAVQEREPVPRE